MNTRLANASPEQFLPNGLKLTDLEEHSVRQTALSHVLESGLPGPKTESWKYVRLNSIIGPELDYEGPSAEEFNRAILDDQLGELRSLPRVVLVNGQLDDALSQRVQESGLITRQAELATDRKSTLNSLGRSPDYAFANLAVAASVEPLEIALEGDATREEPLLVIHLTESGRGAHTQGVIRLAANSHLDILELWLDSHAPNRSSLTNTFWHLELGEGSSCRWTSTQSLSLDSRIIRRVNVQQESNSQFEHHLLDLGAGFARHDVGCSLNGANARCSVASGFLLGESQFVDHHLAMDHRAMNCQSRQLSRGLAGGSSRAVFNGRAVVHPGADGSDIQQSSANLLLDSKAEINTKPELEIYADEVVASHGATVGQLDENALFYLRSRGISRREARRLLMQGFLRSVTDSVDSPLIRGYLLRSAEAALDNTDIENV